MVYVVVLLLVIAAVIGLAAWSNAKRRKALQAVADGLGWTYAPEARHHADPFTHFPLFGQGHGRRASNLLAGDFGGQPMEVFDYRYTTGGGKNQQTHVQTVVHFDLPALRLPPFSVRPENVMHKLITAFGYQDIDIAERPEFSKRFLLRGPDEAAIRRRFADPLPDIFDANRGIGVDGGDSHLFVFRPGRLSKPEGLPDLLTMADEVLRAFLDTEPERAVPPPMAAPPLPS